MAADTKSVSLDCVDVLDKGFVELIDYMGDSDAVVDAARVSYASKAKNHSEEKNDELLTYLIENNHGSPLEMIEFKFRVKAPVVVWWHWVRHRIASYNFTSGRYTTFEDDEYYLPDELRVEHPSNKQASVVADNDVEGWDEEALDLLKIHIDKGQELYQYLLSIGVAKEQARYALPGFVMYYTAIVKMNLRSLVNFLQLRLHERAQYEIRMYAQAILEILKLTHGKLVDKLLECKIISE